MNYLVILNDAPYGTERSCTGLRLSGSLSKQPGDSVSVFLRGDAAACAVAGQTTPNGSYNIERMLKDVRRKGGRVGVCGSCMDARGIGSGALMDGAEHSSLDELTAWTRLADTVFAF